MFHSALFFETLRGAHHLILGVTAPLKVIELAKMIYIQCKITFAII